MHLSYSSNSGAARICQRGPKQGSEVTERGEDVGGGGSPSHGREIFWKFVHENEFLAHWIALLVGWLCEVTYTNPLLPPSFEKLFYSNQGGGGGGMAPCALSYASDGGAARICQRGAKARERSDREGGGCGSCTLDTFIRGSLCSGIHQFPYSCSFFILFLMNLFQGNIFLFPFCLLLFYSPINGGGGAWPPCAS